jgi:hypothetical protein
MSAPDSPLDSIPTDVQQHSPADNVEHLLPLSLPAQNVDLNYIDDLVESGAAGSDSRGAVGPSEASTPAGLWRCLCGTQRSAFDSVCDTCRR